MATIKHCENCQQECYWVKNEETAKWRLIDNETEDDHWKTCPAKRNASRGQANPVLKRAATQDAVMDFLLKLEQRIKKLEDKVYGAGHCVDARVPPSSNARGNGGASDVISTGVGR